MLISTRGRYALRIMVYLAEHQSDAYIPLKTMAEHLGISLKYTSRIVPHLASAGLVDSLLGKGGGYRLKCRPEECSVGEILRLTEGDLAPVACLDCNAEVCDRQDICPTLTMWKNFHHLINDYFDGITLANLMQGHPLP